jgi:NAD(P)-dependent dehydrogenase (short-subunit alcohol dehydrogenase family)
MVIDDSPIPDYASMYRLDGRAFIVAGAGQGMGRQAAHALTGLGGGVYCVDVDADRAEAVAEEVGGIAHVADARDGAQIEQVVAGAKEAFERVDGVVDVIGMARWAALADMPDEDWDWVHGEVLRHAFHLIKFAGPVIAASGGGSMVFVASVDGLSSSPYHGAYGAAKAGLISLVRTAAVELKSRQVRVNVVAPGGVATPRLLRSQGVDDASLITSGTLTELARTSDIASALTFLSCDLSRHITGQCLAVDGGDLAKSPYGISEPPAPPGVGMGEADTWRRDLTR